MVARRTTSIVPDDEPGAIELMEDDQPFDVVKANSSLDDGSDGYGHRRRRGRATVTARARARVAATATATAKATSKEEEEEGDLPALSSSLNSSHNSNSNSNDRNNASNPNAQSLNDSALSQATALTRNVTGGQSARTRPLSPPSRAGLDDPREYQQRKRRVAGEDAGASNTSNSNSTEGNGNENGNDEHRDNENEIQSQNATERFAPSSRGRSYANEMPMDERMEYEDELRALALCDDYDGSQGMPDFCDSALKAMNEICAGATGSGSGAAAGGGLSSTPKPKLKLGERHSVHNGASGVEEQTAIEVEYVEPMYKGRRFKDDDGANHASPKRKKALLRAMTKRARDEFKSKTHSSTKPPKNKEDATSDGEQGATNASDDNIYATFSSIEKRKFLKLINGGVSPLDATNTILKDRTTSGNNDQDNDEKSHDSDDSDYYPGIPDDDEDEEQEQEGQAAVVGDSPHSRAGKKGINKLAFWKRKSSGGSTSGSTLVSASARVVPPARVSPERDYNGYEQQRQNEEEGSDGSVSSCEQVGDEIKTFLRAEREKVKKAKKATNSKPSAGATEIIGDLQNENYPFDTANTNANANNNSNKEADDHQFERSGINYYDAVRKDRSGETYETDNFSESGASSRKHRKLKIPKSIKGGLSKLAQRTSNRPTPVPDEAETERIATRATSTTGVQDKQMIESHASIPSPTKETLRIVGAAEGDEPDGFMQQASIPQTMSRESLLDDEGEVHPPYHLRQEAMERELARDDSKEDSLDMDAYLSETVSQVGGGSSSHNNRSFDGVSVVSGRSHRTAGTNHTTQSTRSRRPGQAKVRLEQKKEALNISGISSKSHGWQESIEVAALKVGKVWDPSHGWKDYVDPNSTEIPTDDFFDESMALAAQQPVDAKSVSTAPSEAETASNEQPLSPGQSIAKLPKSPRSPLSRSGRKGRPQKVPTVTSPKGDKPRGWAETMRAAAARLDIGAKKWDPVKGWVGLSEEDSTIVAGVSERRDALDNVGITAESDLQDFGTVAHLDAIANKQDKSMQFLSEDEEPSNEANNNYMEEEETTFDGDQSSEMKSTGATKSISNNSGRYVQIAETGSVQSHYRRAKADPNSKRMVNVKRENLNQGELDMFQESAERRKGSGPVDLDSLYEEEEHDVSFGPGSGAKVVSGPNANAIYQSIYESQSNGSFDGEDFSWDADDAVNESVDSHGRKPAPRLKIKIRDTASVSSRPNSAKSATKSQSEASFDSGSSPIPKLAAPKRDTSPIRAKPAKTNAALVSKKIAPALSSSHSAQDDDSPFKTDDAFRNTLTSTQNESDEDGDNHDAAVSSVIEKITPTALSNPRTKTPPKISELHKLWEAKTAKRDNENPSSKRKDTQNTEWKSFLGKKVDAESAAAAGMDVDVDVDVGPGPDPHAIDEDRDSTFDFDGEYSGNLRKSSEGKVRHGDSNQVEPEDASAFDDISELSPIRHHNEDSETEYGQHSEASTSVLQGTTFLQRLQACAAPVVKSGTKCVAESPMSAHLAFLRNNQRVPGGSPDIKNGGKSGILQASAGICGRPDVIDEEDESTMGESAPSRSTMQSASPNMIKSRDSNSRSRSNPRSRQNASKDDLSSVISDGFGAKSAYLEAIAMKAAVSGGSKKKKRRSQGSEASATTATSRRSSPGSSVSASNNVKRSEKFQQFLDRRAAKDEQSKQSTLQPSRSAEKSEVSSRAEKYASEKMNEMMDSMDNRGRAQEEYEKSGAFPKLPGATNTGNDAVLSAAEELAAARVEAMMQRLSAQDLERNEAEI